MKFWVGGEISSRGQNFVFGVEFHVEEANFMLEVKFLVWGRNICEIGQFNAKKFT